MFHKLFTFFSAGGNDALTSASGRLNHSYSNNTNHASPGHAQATPLFGSAPSPSISLLLFRMALELQLYMGSHQLLPVLTISQMYISLA